MRKRTWLPGVLVLLATQVGAGAAGCVSYPPTNGTGGSTSVGTGGNGTASGGTTFCQTGECYTDCLVGQCLDGFTSCQAMAAAYCSPVGSGGGGGGGSFGAGGGSPDACIWGACFYDCLGGVCLEVSFASCEDMAGYYCGTDGYGGLGGYGGAP